MKILIIFLSLILLGCNGERENSATHTGLIINAAAYADKDFVPEFDNVRKSELFIEIKPEIKYEAKRVDEYDLPVKKIDLDNGFRHTGNYVEDGCAWKIYKKGFEVSWLYIHVDCKGNRLKIQMPRGK